LRSRGVATALRIEPRSVLSLQCSFASGAVALSVGREILIILAGDSIRVNRRVFGLSRFLQVGLQFGRWRSEIEGEEQAPPTDGGGLKLHGSVDDSARPMRPAERGRHLLLHLPASLARPFEGIAVRALEWLAVCLSALAALHLERVLEDVERLTTDLRAAILR